MNIPKRLLRFRLRTQLAFVGALAVAFAWTAGNYQQARGQRQLLSSLQQSANVIWGYEWSRQPDRYPHWVPAWLMRSLGEDFFGNVIVINFDGSVESGPWDDAEFARVMNSLKGFPALEVVGFGERTATESQWSHISRQLPNVRIIRGGFGPDSGRNPF